MDSQRLTEYAIKIPVAKDTDEEAGYLNKTFEEKLTKGWLKYYFNGIIVFGFMTLIHSLFQIKNFFSTLSDNYMHSIGHIGSAVVIFLLALSIFTQYKAIKLRSLLKQELAIKIGLFFVIVSTVYHPLAIFFLFDGSLFHMFSGVYLTVLAVGYIFLANNIRDIMLGKGDQSFRFDKSAFLA